MFDVVLDRRLQIVDRCRDRLGLLGEAQLPELFRISLMSHSHWANLLSESGGHPRTEDNGSP
jgi:hypothetical protein